MPRKNLVINPSLETGTTGWAVASSSATITRSTARSYSGSASLSVAPLSFPPTLTAPPAAVTPGQVLSGSLRIWSPGAVNADAKIRFFNSSMSVVGGVNGASVAVPAGAWTELKVEGVTAPANAAFASVATYLSIGSQTVHLDAALLEVAPTAGTYFDGDTPGYRWDGAPHASTSSTAPPAAPFDILDNLRLEVEVEPPGLRNHVSNPDGRLGAWGWTTPAAFPTAVVDGSSAASLLRLKNTSTTTAYSIYTDSEPVPCAAGAYASGRIFFSTRTTSAEQVVLRLVFLDANGAQTGTSTAALGTSTGFVTTPTTQAPAGTAKVALRVQASTSGGGILAGREVFWHQTILVQAPTSAALSSYPYVEPIVWSSILGPTHELRWDRRELDAGVLSATVLDATLDPAQATGIRPGRAVRVTALDPSSSLWKPLYTGRITSARTTYDYRRPVAQRARVTLEAADNAKTLANVPRPDGVSSVPHLAALLEGAGVPWRVNGSTGHIPPVAYSTRNENASALDQVAIVRDSQLGYAWIRPDGVLQVNSEGTLPSEVRATLGPADYTALDVDFDTQRLINSVVVKLLRRNAATGETVEVTHGPFVDQESVDRWGAFSKEFTVQGLADDAAYLRTEYAQRILDANSEPQVRVNQLTLAVTRPAHVSTSRALLDLYDRVAVQHGDATDDSRVTAVSHSVTSGPTTADCKWLVTLSFASEGGVAQPTQAPALVSPAPAALPADLTFNPTSQGGGAATGWVRLTGGSITVAEAGVYLIYFLGVFGTGTIAATTPGRRGVGVSTVSGATSVDGDMVNIVGWGTASSGSMSYCGFKELPAGAVICPWRYNDVANHYSAGGGFLRAVRVG